MFFPKDTRGDFLYRTLLSLSGRSTADRGLFVDSVQSASIATATFLSSALPELSWGEPPPPQAVTFLFFWKGHNLWKPLFLQKISHSPLGRLCFTHGNYPFSQGNWGSFSYNNIRRKLLILSGIYQVHILGRTWFLDSFVEKNIYIYICIRVCVCVCNF